MTRPVLMIDNFDSFTFNLVEGFERLGCPVRVLRNTVAPERAFAIARQSSALIVLSPGPGDPSGAGCCLELVGLAKGELPLAGICLGHQAIVERAGGQVTRAPLPVHGKSGLLSHDGNGPFAGLPSPLRIGRYHSLRTEAIPARFTIHGEIDGTVMAISDTQALQTGLQFHPESILTTEGNRILANLLPLGRSGVGE